MRVAKQTLGERFAWGGSRFRRICQRPRMNEDYKLAQKIDTGDDQGKEAQAYTIVGQR